MKKNFLKDKNFFIPFFIPLEKSLFFKMGLKEKNKLAGRRVGSLWNFLKGFLGNLLILFISVFIIYISASAENEEKLVTDVRIENNKTISTQTILSKIKTRPGTIFSQEIINEDLKRLYATDYFTDVSVDIKEFNGGYVVTFKVREKPVLSEIIFEGNKSISTERLKALLTVEVGKTLDMRILKDNLDKARKLYEKKGFHKVKIDYEIDVNEITNEAILYILVEEGIRYRIARIFVKGNRAISTKEILRSMKTRRDTLLTSGFFKEEAFEQDLERIKSLYLKRGYSDVKIDPQLDYNASKKIMYITLLIDEGKQYRVGKIEISGNEKFASEDIRKTLKMNEGDTFSQVSLEEDASSISGFYFERGFIFAQVKPEAVFNEKTQKIDITYYIQEGELAYIDKVIIRGNDKTKDIVIRRELRFAPGEPFDGKKLQRSKERLYNLGFFEEVTYDTEPSLEPNKKNLVVNVKETKTGEFSFGAGYSSLDKFIGFVQIAQRNFDIANPPTFTGDGQELKLKASFGTERENYLLSFTEPWIFDYPLSFGFDGFRTFRSWEDFDLERTGGDIRFSKEFTDYTKGDLMYKFEEVNMSSVGVDVSSEIRDEEGAHNLSRLLLGLRNDTRDNTYFPTKGHILSSSLEYAGTFLGGDKDYFKIEGEGRQYFTHFKKFVLELRLRVGFTEELSSSSNIPVYECFYLGGPETIRGYRWNHVSPKDAAGNPIGGKSMLVANAEYTFPIITNIRGAIFYDAGNAWREIDDFGSDFKSAVGVGVRVKTPLGPIKVDYGYGLDYDPGEQKGRFHFSMSRSF
jgi:outer membrane protein insertion porin family